MSEHEEDSDVYTGTIIHGYSSQIPSFERTGDNYLLLLFKLFCAPVSGGLSFLIREREFARAQLSVLIEVIYLPIGRGLEKLQLGKSIPFPNLDFLQLNLILIPLDLFRVKVVSSELNGRPEIRCRIKVSLLQGY